jgi:hypothetical protein
MAEFLVRAVDSGGSGAGQYLKGDIVEVRADGSPYGNAEGLPGFIIVKIPGLLIRQLRSYALSWERVLTFSVVSSDLVTDSFRLKLSAGNMSSSLKGIVTRAEVELLISKWGGVIVSEASNEVVFDISILDAIKSAGFWDVNVLPTVFTETAYDQATGVHTIELNYSNIKNNPTYIEDYIERKTGEQVLSHDGVNKIITFNVDRSDIRTGFEKDIKEKAKKMTQRRRWYFAPAQVDTVVGMGGVVTVTRAQAQANLRDRLLE